MCILLAQTAGASAIPRIGFRRTLRGCTLHPYSVMSGKKFQALTGMRVFATPVQS
jgi:hypothetical protein